jgi:hypothetical protein
MSLIIRAIVVTVAPVRVGDEIEGSGATRTLSII